MFVHLNKGKDNIRSRLLNLIGFFSTLGPEAGTSAVAVDILWPWDGALKGALTKGCRGLRRLKGSRELGGLVAAKLRQPGSEL